MATLSVGPGDYIKPRIPGVRIRQFTTEPSEADYAGDPVIESTSTDNKGGVKLAGSDPTTIVGFLAEATDSTSAIGALKTALVHIADKSAEFVGRVQDGATVDKSARGLVCGLVADTTNHIWRVDTTETTAASVKITDVLDPGDVNSRVVFQVQPAYRSYAV